MGTISKEYKVWNDQNRELEIKHLSNGDFEIYIGTPLYGRGEGMTFLLSGKERLTLIEFLSADPPIAST